MAKDLAGEFVKALPKIFEESVTPWEAFGKCLQFVQDDRVIFGIKSDDLVAAQFFEESAAFFTKGGLVIKIYVDHRDRVRVKIAHLARPEEVAIA